MDLLDGIDVACPACGRRSRYPVVHAGKTVSCPSCKHEHLLPATKDASGVHAGLPPAPPAAPNPPVAPPAPAKPTTAPLAGAKIGESDKILFVCASCQYRARIPAQYAGMAVKCPSCDAAQIATADTSGSSTGNTVQLSKLPAPGHKTTIRPGNVLFICSLCNFEAQLAKHYVGKAIRCPGCHAPQVVAGEPPPKEPAALERHSPATADAAPTSDPRFICVGCGYRARIPAQYMGLAVTCPKCDTVQIATPEEQEGPATGDTVAISKIKTAEDGAKIANPQVAAAAPAEPGIKMPTSKAPPAAPAKGAATAAAGGGDKVRFTCSACGFKARIPSTYAGENIHCPGCNSVQLVLRSGQLSPNATGNTQIIQVVQTAAAAGSPDAIATPTHTPAKGVPVIQDPAAPPTAKAAVAKPAAPPVAKPAPPAPPAPPPVAKAISPIMPPPPAVPVAQPAGTAKAETTIDDLLNFEEPPPAEDAKAAGKVVRRGSDRLKAVGATKTPLPEPAKPAAPVAKSFETPKPAIPAIPEAKMPEEVASKPAASALPEIDEDPPSDPLPAPVAKTPAKPAVKTDRTTKSAAARPEPKAPMSESAPAKQSNAMVVLVAIFCFGLLGAVGFLGYQMMENGKQLTQLTSDLGNVNRKLDETQKQLSDANAKLTKAEEDAKVAKEAADLAAKKQAEEAAARKASEEKAAELEAKLKAAEEAAAKAAAEKPATPVEAPK
jgi:Zn finger protein HypA/HybF involved in hydrogenase expression